MVRYFVFVLLSVTTCGFGAIQEMPDLIYAAQVERDSTCQLWLGFVYELEGQFEDAALWYARAIAGGSIPALKRLGTLAFYGKGVPKNEEVGLYLVALGLRCSEEHLEHHHVDKKNIKQDRERGFDASFGFASDRWDPTEENSRIYGPGTGDWNQGVLRSEYEEIERNYNHLMTQIEGLQSWSDQKKLDDLRGQIERLLTESKQYKSDAYNEFLCAVASAIEAGAVVCSIPILAPFIAHSAIEGFKNAAKDYVKSVDIQKEAKALLDMERSLEKTRSFGGRE